MAPKKDWTDPFRAARISAVHLEMRDVYAVGGEAERFATWRASGERVDARRDAELHRQAWMTLVRDMVARGVSVRRARIVSEPLSEYIRWEHAITVPNLDAGEDVRWLPRRQASGLCLPGNDFWLFDNAVVRWGHFSGDGDFLANELSTDPVHAKLCADAFDAVWNRAVPHEEYGIR